MKLQRMELERKSKIIFSNYIHLGVMCCFALLFV